MKEAVELANALLGPRSNAQQIDGPLKKPLHLLACAVLEADRKIQELNEIVAAYEKGPTPAPELGSYEKQDQDDLHT